MRNLMPAEYHAISGGALPALVIIGTGVAGGLVATYLVSYIKPVTTLLGTIGGSIGLGMLCEPILPEVGALGCAAVGGCVGYYTTSYLANSVAFVAGALATGYIAAMY